MPDPILRIEREIDAAAYDTDLPLIVAERCRTARQYADGTRAEPPGLLAVWYALRWLMAAFPERDGFGQRAIAHIAGVDQKGVHKRLKLLHELDLVTEVGERTFDRLTGKDEKAKVQKLYSIPLRELRAQSAQQVATLVRDWEIKLFGGPAAPPPGPQPPPDLQLALDLSDPLTDQAPDPLTDQSDPLTDQAPDPLTDQSDPLTDQAPEPLTDQALDPLEDHMGRKEGRKEGRNAACASRALPDIPTAPPDEPPLTDPPLTLWALAHDAPAPSALDERLLLQLAAEHDAPTGGYGLYWLGRAIATVAMGGPVTHWLGAVRAVLRRWRESESYGSDAPAGPARQQRPRQPRDPTPPGAAPGAARPSPGEISLAAHITGQERATWLRRFRAADGPDAQRAVLAAFAAAHPPPASAAAD